MQHEYMDKLVHMMDSADKATKFLKQSANYNSTSDSLNKKLLHHLLANHSINDPYIKNSLLVLQRNYFKTLKSRSHIPIPCSRNLKGVADFTGKLQYGQLFCCVDYRDGGSYPLTGHVLVGKNPCLDQGDIRKLECIMIPELMHLKNCIIFPTNGDRPHCNEMAGSDMDGDDYIIIWDSTIVKEFTPVPARDYNLPQQQQTSLLKALEHLVPHRQKHKSKQEQAKAAAELDRQLMTRVKQYYIDYMNKNQLGHITNLHTQWSDLHGIDHPISIILADKFYTAVDAAKTGENVIIEPELRDKVSAIQIPHYMRSETDSSKDNSAYRHSTSIIGKLYDAVVEFEAKYQQEQKQQQQLENSNQTKKAEIDPDLMIKGNEHYAAIAVSELSKYMEESAKMKRNEENVTNDDWDRLRNKYRNRFVQHVISSNSASEITKKYAYCASLGYQLLASAYYLASYQMSKDNSISFCWEVCGHVLDRIKADAQARAAGRQLATTIAPSQMRSLNINKPTMNM